MYIFVPKSERIRSDSDRICTPLNCVLQPRSQAPGAGHVVHRKLIAYGGEGKVILHASTYALYTSIARSECSVQPTLRIIYTSKYLLNLIRVCF